MERIQLDSILVSNDYLEGGIKEACILVKKYLENARIDSKVILSSESCVTIEEFIKSVRTLMAFASQHDDAMPKMWYCDSDCSKVTSQICPGEFSLDKTSSNLCPFFTDESNK